MTVFAVATGSQILVGDGTNKLLIDGFAAMRVARS